MVITQLIVYDGRDEYRLEFENEIEAVIAWARAIDAGFHAVTRKIEKREHVGAEVPS